MFAIPYAGIEALQSEGLLSRIKEAKCGESDNEHIGKAERFSVSDSRAESVKKVGAVLSSRTDHYTKYHEENSLEEIIEYNFENSCFLYRVDYAARAY